MDSLLGGSVALVTGASAGLGRHFAMTLAEAGAAVVVTARRADALDELVDQIETNGGRALACPLDIADAAAIPALFDKAEATFGTIDIIVNNAGIPDANYATRLTLDTIDRVIDVDFRAPFVVAAEAARRLIAQEKPGRIVNLSSVAAFNYTPSSASALYAACKSGIIRMTEALAIEWARYRINVNAIAPGMFESEMTESYIRRTGGTALEHFPRRRYGKPADLDSTLLYLVSPASHFVTGTCIIVDDAQTVR